MTESEPLEADDADEPRRDPGVERPYVDRREGRRAARKEREAEAATSGGVGPLLRGAAVMILVVMGSCLGGTVVRWMTQIVNPPDDAPPPEVIEVQPTPDVIVAMRDLARLETASYHVERVVDMRSDQRRLFGLVEASDSILLVAASDVVAGVDLTRLGDEDITVIDRRRVLITLPPAEIFSAALDNDRTYVYERDTDTLARRREDLETRARREAERTLRQSAIEGGILERADRNARTTVIALVRSMGFDEVEVTVRPRVE